MTSNIDLDSLLHTIVDHGNRQCKHIFFGYIASVASLSKKGKNLQCSLVNWETKPTASSNAEPHHLWHNVGSHQSRGTGAKWFTVCRGMASDSKPPSASQLSGSIAPAPI